MFATIYTFIFKIANNEKVVNLQKGKKQRIGQKTHPKCVQLVV